MLFLSATPMHLPRLWTDAPVAKSKSRGEQNSRGSKGSTQSPQHTQPEKEEKEKPAKHNEKKGPGVATTGRGAGKAEEDRAEKAAHITLE